MAGSAAARRCRRSPTIPATPTARAAREQIPLLGRRRRKLDKISWHGAAARWWLRRRGRLRGRSRCRGWRGQYRSQRAPPRASSRPTSRCPPSLRRPGANMGVSSCLLLDASVDAAVLTVVVGRVVDGFAPAASRALASPMAPWTAFFLCAPCTVATSRRRSGARKPSGGSASCAACARRRLRPSVPG